MISEQDIRNTIRKFLKGIVPGENKGSSNTTKSLQIKDMVDRIGLDYTIRVIGFENFIQFAYNGDYIKFLKDNKFSGYIVRWTADELMISDQIVKNIKGEDILSNGHLSKILPEIKLPPNLTELDKYKKIIVILYQLDEDMIHGQRFWHLSSCFLSPEGKCAYGLNTTQRNYVFKEVIKRYNLEKYDFKDKSLNESVPLFIRRRINFDKDYIKKLIDMEKKMKFNPVRDVQSNVGNTIFEVAYLLSPSVPEYETSGIDEEDFDSIVNFWKRYLHQNYGDYLTDFFEKEIEKYQKREPSNVKYIFIKHDAPLNGKWKGFSESYDYFDDLVYRRGDWIDVDWDEIEKKLDNIDKYYDDGFDGRKKSAPILLKKIDEPGNDWGYNFSIMKSIKK